MSVCNDNDDPSEFTTVDLQTIDENVRCPICREMLTTAMLLTTCSHSFCSLCIRRSLSVEQQCPTCRIPALETNLIQNYDLNTIIRSWRHSRNLLLKMDKQFNNNQSAPQLTCTNLDGGEKSLNSSFLRKKKPMKLDYAAMSDKALTDCLQSLDIPDHGERSQKIWRHKEYMNLYYANCDSQKPVEANVLVQQLRELEKAQFSNIFKRKAADPDIHKKRYADQFSSLVHNAKRAKKR